jgi:hypothetical protein
MEDLENIPTLLKCMRTCFIQTMTSNGSLTISRDEAYDFYNKV